MKAKILFILFLLLPQLLSSLASSSWLPGVPLPYAVSYAASCTDPETNEIYLLGGAVDDQFDQAIKYAATGIWIPLPSLPVSSLYAPSCAVWDGKVYLTGGKSNDTVTNSLFIFDVTAKSWSSGPPMLFSRAEHASVAVLGKIYAIAGFGARANNNQSQSHGSPLASVEVYSPSSGTWSLVPSFLPIPCYAPAAVAKQNVIYVLGGNSRLGFLASTLRYDPADDAKGWVAEAKMLTPLSWASAVVWLDGTIMIAGGSNGPDDVANTSLYDPATNAWTSGPPLPQPRLMVGMGTFVTGNLFNAMIIGGVEKKGTAVTATSSTLVLSAVED